MFESNPGNPRVQDRATLDATEILEILQDAYPDIVQSERNYGLTKSRVARFLRDRDSEIENDVTNQFFNRANQET